MPTASDLYYYDSEPDNYQRPPVLLIHGAAGQHLSWPPQVRRLHNQRMFAVDLPGHGKSEGIGRHRIADYVSDLVEFINEIRLNAAVWIGHSMGGAIALEAALRFPQRVLGLGLLATGARLRVDPLLMRHASDEATFPAAVRLMGERSFGPRSSPRLKELVLQRMADLRSSVVHGDLMACDLFDVMDTIDVIDVPTLILCGAEDQMAPPRYSEYLHTRIQASTLQIVANAGHMVMLEQPEAVAGFLGGFLDSIRYTPGR